MFSLFFMKVTGKDSNGIRWQILGSGNDATSAQDSLNSNLQDLTKKLGDSIEIEEVEETSETFPRTFAHPVKN